MNSKSHSRAGPKRKRRLLQRRSRKLGLWAEYHLLCLAQARFDFVFRLIEQRKGRITDRLANWMTEP